MRILAVVVVAVLLPLSGQCQTIITQPQSVAVTDGTTASFYVSATDALPLSYQWQFYGTNLVDGGDISGSTTTNLVINQVNTNDVGGYDVVLTDSSGSETSIVAVLTIPPIILSQPQSIAATNGATVSFGVSVSGDPPLSFQWQLDGTNLADGGDVSGSATTNLVLNPLTANYFGYYDVIISSPWGSATSSSALLTPPIVILAQPQSIAATNGTAASFSVTVSDVLPVSFQWQFDGTNIAGGLYTPNPNPTSTLFLNQLSTNNIGDYDVIISDPVSSVTSSVAALTLPLIILSQPQNIALTNGAAGSFNVSVSGAPPFSFQWQFDGTNLTDGADVSGSSTTNLVLTQADTDEVGSYDVIVTGSGSSETSSVATLTIPPIILSQPQNISVISGASASFAVSATGLSPLSYQWQFDGVNMSDGTNISGSTTTNLAINQATDLNAGSYDVIVADTWGSVTSSVAVLTVTITYTTNTSIGAGNSPANGQNIIITNCTLTVDGAHTFNSIQIQNGGVLTHSSSTSGCKLTITSNAQIQAGAAINISGEGYTGGNGINGGTGSSQSTNYPYEFTAGGGGGHGGCGGMSSTFAAGGAAYDSMVAPLDLGSGGGEEGGAGGGAIELTVGGTLQMDGQILASGVDATNAHSGGGAGGSIWLSSQTFSGAGAIAANGGRGQYPDGGGGGGGMIAISFAISNFTGSTSAIGGVGATAGGAGTIYTKITGAPSGQLLIANGGTAGTNTFFSGATISNLTISGGAIAQPQSGTFTVNNLFIGSNSSLTMADNTVLALTVNGNATVDTNASIIADFKSTSGGGNGNSSSCNNISSGSGGGFGGIGGASACGAAGGNAYGSITAPPSLGSTGGAGSTKARGGGAITLTVSGTLSLAGTISANGGSSSAILDGGGGSGGAIQLTAGAFSGNGTVSANGGAADNAFGGGGGGGRAAIAYTSNLFTGSIVARGGAGANNGGAGTVYFATHAGSALKLIIDNGGAAGALTPNSSSFGALDLTVTGGASFSNSSSLQVVNNLFVGSNSAILGYPSTGGAITVLTNLTIQSGGRIILDGLSSGGNDVGQTLASTGGGGGMGGCGGASASGAAGGNALSGQTTSPTSAGSHGGGGINGNGGNGGGAFHFFVDGTLDVDGLLSANGVTSSSLNSGGGSGGSIWLTAGIFSGAGTISANGGAGNGLGGGGGGGIVSINYKTNLFAGAATARGGAATNIGGAGTVYWATQTGGSQLLVIDNGGASGAITPLTYSTANYNLAISGGAVASNTISSLTLGNLVVGSNSTFLGDYYTSAQETVTVLTNATVQSGGRISLDGLSTGGSDPGQSLNSTGGGGAGGGNGGASADGAAGGATYLGANQISNPSTAGSRGGAGAGIITNFGGNGGGAIHLTVDGTLDVEGQISANGVTSAGANSGGGGGGAIWLTAGIFSGTGTLVAGGGAGNGLGGGGGGGSIAVYYKTNLFSGSMTAHGGTGANAGGAGTVYSATQTSLAQQVIIDNGGMQGASTSLAGVSGTFNLTVSGSATVSNTLSSVTFGNLLVGSNSTFIGDSYLEGSMTVLTNATVQSGGRISMDGLAVNGSGPGQSLANTGGGGGYGGYGGASASNALGGNVYDSISAPSSGGSRGGSGINGIAGGGGGGSLHLIIDGVLQVDGTVSANGLTSIGTNSGGGSGGALYLTIGTLSGAGLISANGGAANNLGGGGGGGRIAIYYNTNLFAGGITARGGAGANYGGGGTIYSTKQIDGTPQVTVENGGVRATNTLLNTSGGTWNFTITNGGSVSLFGSQSWNSLTVASNSALGFSGSSQITLTIMSNLTILPGGSISLDGLGSVANSGTGHGSYASSGSIYIGGGGGHGGYGGGGNLPQASGGITYDSITSPDISGSGGGSLTTTNGSAGGGALHLTVNKTFTVNGSITANGTAGIPTGAGGGAGGSLWLSTGTLSGNGTISANGGAGEFYGGGGGGAGGLIAIYFASNQFTGGISTRGGSGYALAGGAGIVYLKTNSANYAQIILDNGGLPGTNTPITSIPQPVSLLVRGGAAANSSSSLTLQNLSITTGGLLDVIFSQMTVSLTVLGNALVDTNSAINVNGDGYPSPFGPCGGVVDDSGFGSGGGYGGAGGASLQGAPGGLTYGSFTQPTDYGSSGGLSPVIASFSEGGGAIYMQVDGALTVNGNISANGDNGEIEGAGGGSGGSIWILAKQFSGNGSINADGGNGESGQGGGGGGGRIALYVNTNLYAGQILASGGTGASPGQAGTIYIPTNFIISGSVTDTNGTPLSGIVLQPTALQSVVTDSNGLYSVVIPPFWSGNVTPVSNGALYVPGSYTYANLAGNLAGQNFVVASAAAFNFSGAVLGGTTNVNLNWYAISGVVYQPMSSTDLVNWVPYGPPLSGSNGPIVLSIPITNAPGLFFRLGVSY